MIVEIKNLVKRYNDTVAIDHLNLTIEQGDVYGLLGPNGAGKTTTINCLMSLLKIDKGSIEILGRQMTPNSYEIKRLIGVVPQEPAVFHELTVYENISYFASLYVREKEEIPGLVGEAMDFVHLKHYSNYYPDKLSEGLLKRLNIACGIVHKPRLLILDEPTSGVDPKNRSQILQGIKGMREAGTTVIFTTHYMEEAESICNKITILDRGKSIASGSIEELTNLVTVGEKISIEVYQLTTNHLTEIREIPNIYQAEYKNHVLELRSKQGKNNLLHVMTYLTDHHLNLGRISTKQPTLTDVFLELTGTRKDEVRR